jgi:hypothetical protein
MTKRVRMATQSANPPEVVDPQSPAARRARWVRWWFFVTVALIAPFALILAAVLLILLWWQLTHLAAIGEVQDEVARIQAAGEPVTTADLYAFHRVPQGTNDITPLWLAAMKSCNSQMNQLGPAAHQRVPIVGTGDRALLVADVPGSLLPETEDLLAKYDPTVQAILTAARASGECRYPVPFENGTAAVLAHGQHLRGLSRIMSLRTRVAAARGKPDLAIESIEANLAVAQSFSHQVSMVEHLVRVAVTGVAIADTEHLVSESDLTEEQLLRLQSQLQDVGLEDGFTHALLGERGLGYHSFHAFVVVPAPGPPTAAAGPMSGGKLINPKPCLIYMHVMQEFIDTSRAPAAQSLLKTNQIRAKLQTQQRSSNPLARMNAFAAAQILPACEAAFAANARTQAFRDLVLLAIAAQRYRLAHGADPTTLEQLIPEFLSAVPLDPFDGKPLRMKVVPGELIFYSVGMDRKDDGGSDPQDTNTPDFVVRLRVKMAKSD